MAVKEMEKELGTYSPIIKKFSLWAYKQYNFKVPLEEIIQSATVGLWKAIETYNGYGDFNKYLNKKIRWQVIDDIRSLSGRNREKRLSISTNDIKNIFIDDSFIGEIDSKDTLNFLIRPLNLEDADIIKKYFCDNYTMKEIGLQCGFTESYISLKVKMSICILKRFLKSKEIFW